MVTPSWRVPAVFGHLSVEILRVLSRLGGPELQLLICALNRTASKMLEFRVLFPSGVNMGIWRRFSFRSYFSELSSYLVFLYTVEVCLFSMRKRMHLLFYVSKLILEIPSISYSTGYFYIYF